MYTEKLLPLARKTAEFGVWTNFIRLEHMLFSLSFNEFWFLIFIILNPTN